LTCTAIVLQLYLTDLSTRESVLVCNNEHPVLQLALQDDTIWVATTDSSVYGWPAEGRAPHKVFQKGGSFLAGNLSFSRARASLEGSAPVCGLLAVYPFCLSLCYDELF
jgi:WD repeat-containing protein 48